MGTMIRIYILASTEMLLCIRKNDIQQSKKQYQNQNMAKIELRVVTECYCEHHDTYVLAIAEKCFCVYVKMV